MQIKTIIINALLAGAGLAQLQVLQTAIQQVQESLGKLDTAVKAMTDINSAAALLTASTDTQKVMEKATTDIKAAQVLSLQDALGLQQAAGPLTAAVKTVTDDLVAKKPVLDQIGATQQAVQTLKDQKKSAGALGEAVVSKVPAIGQGIAQQTIGQMTTLLDGAITAFGGSPTTKLRRSVPMPLVV